MVPRRPAPGSRAPLVPRTLVILLGAASMVIVLTGARAVAWLIGPAALALIIVIAIAPLRTRLHRLGWPGWASTLVLVVAIYAIMIGLALGIIVSIAQLATELPRYTGQATAMLHSSSARLAELGIGPEQIAAARESLDPGKVAALLGSLLSSVAGLASNLVFLLALLLFLALEASGAGERLASIAVDREPVADALQRFAHGSRQYLIVTTVFGLIVAVLDTIALALLGVPLAVTWGLLAFITNYIPNVGFVIGVVPPALLALFVGGPGLAVTVIVVYMVLNFVVQSLIQPRFIGDAVGLSVTVTFVSLMFWAWLLGALGAILAVPLTLFCKAVLVDIDPRVGWADALLRSTPGAAEPDPEPAEPDQGTVAPRDRTSSELTTADPTSSSPSTSSQESTATATPTVP